jgi:asparagine synthase (glutamine-hydrolysing)
MTDKLAHRGPDGSGEWCDDNVGIALGHRRLAVLDLSAEGHQPMSSESGRFVISFNGEIYNHAELRLELGPAYHWRGHSDTEVMLASISLWGLERAVSKFVGMFAFALWDRSERVLHLVRDRLGEKPLYYGALAGGFVFASELGAFREFARTALEVDRNALAGLLQFGYVPAPMSIYKGVKKLEPGALLSLKWQTNGTLKIGEPRRYWTLDDESIAPRRRSFEVRDEQSLVNELEALLRQSVRQQMVADVPLGAFLSGGIDSSVIVALMQTCASQAVRTFTIGFEEKAYNEAGFAAAVARHLGTEHTELILTPRDVMEVIPRLPSIYDEPFADSSQIPTFLVSQMTRQSVTVCLSGDGGDELFAGYPRYQFGSRLWRSIQRVPGWGRAVAAATISGFSASNWDRILSPLGSNRISGHRLHRLARVMRNRTFAEAYVGMVSQWVPADGLVAGITGAAPKMDRAVRHEHVSLLNEMRRFDIDHYLPDDLLVKVDRASMSVSLEARAPFLDHRVAEFAWALPERVLVRNGEGKWLLRRVLERHVPRNLTDRPKAGFAVPIASWLRGSLREWAESLLSEDTLRRQGFLATAPIRRMWQEHLVGAHDRHAYLWNALMFQAWLESSSAPRDLPDTSHLRYRCGNPAR